MNQLKNTDGTESYGKIRECIDTYLQAKGIGFSDASGPTPMDLDALSKGKKGGKPGEFHKGSGGAGKQGYHNNTYSYPPIH